MDASVLEIEDFTNFGFTHKSSKVNLLSFSICDNDPVNYLFLTYNLKTRAIIIKADTKVYGNYRFLVNSFKVDSVKEVEYLLDSLIFNGISIKQHINRHLYPALTHNPNNMKKNEKTNSFWSKFSLPLSPEMSQSMIEITGFVMCAAASFALIIVSLIALLSYLKGD